MLDKDRIEVRRNSAKTPKPRSLAKQSSLLVIIVLHGSGSDLIETTMGVGLCGSTTIERCTVPMEKVQARNVDPHEKRATRHDPLRKRAHQFRHRTCTMSLSLRFSQTWRKRFVESLSVNSVLSLLEQHLCLAI